MSERIRLAQTATGFTLEAEDDVTIDEIITFLEVQGHPFQAAKMVEIKQTMAVAHAHGPLPGITDLPFWHFLGESV